jgi:hypothetical protein
MAQTKQQTEDKIRTLYAQLNELEVQYAREMLSEIDGNTRHFKPSRQTKYKINILQRNINQIAQRWNKKVMLSSLWQAESKRLTEKLDIINEQLSDINDDILELSQRIDIATAAMDKVRMLLLISEHRKLIDKKIKIRQQLTKTRFDIMNHNAKKPIVVTELCINLENKGENNDTSNSERA